MKIVPLGNRVLVKPDDEERGKKTSGGIYLPDNATEKPATGTVESIGYGHRDNGELIPVAVQPGARVYYSKYGGVTIEDGRILMREDDILAIIEE